MKTLLKKIIPRGLLSYYHKILARFGAFLYRYPSNKMLVIGVTGTNGKTTTVAMIARALEAGGYRVGALSTAFFKVADEEVLNNKKMTMLGRFQLQKYLSRMIKAGCQYAIVETSSQGIEQFRHLGINYDYVVFTNLTPEHIEAHGGFENYKKAKGKLFQFLTTNPRKTLAQREIKKTSFVNLDDEHAYYFAGFPADNRITFSTQDKTANFLAENIRLSTTGTTFDCGGATIELKLLGAFNVYNALPAMAIAVTEGVSLDKIKLGLESIAVMPGRMELIKEGQPYTVVIDYAPEPYSMAKLYETVELLPKNKIIHVLGSCGGGRDVARRPVLGNMAGAKADYVIVTNEDPYDDDPQVIIDQVAGGALESGKVLDQNLFKIMDRREAIARALSLATENDLVLITGKGSEQAMAVADGKHIPWDDRVVTREILKSIK